MENKINDEISRTRALRLLLFEPSVPYGGDTLFAKFDEDIQIQIQIFLEELLAIIDEAHQLMFRRHGNPNLQASGEDTARLVTAEPSKKPSRTLLRLRWVGRDKKRVEAIVRNFGELNSRILEHTKLWCLGTAIGVDLQHLKRLENDQNSKQLGFDVDAKLQLTASNLDVPSGTLQILDARLYSSIQTAKKIEDRFGFLEWNGQNFLVEYRSYAPDSPVSVDIDSRTERLIDDLAKLLHQPKEPMFRTPSCSGWTNTSLMNQIAFLFVAPQDAKLEPRSLFRLLAADLAKPSLSDKFHLSYQLARCISRLQLVRWVGLRFVHTSVWTYSGFPDATLGSSIIKWSFAPLQFASGIACYQTCTAIPLPTSYD